MITELKHPLVGKKVRISFEDGNGTPKRSLKERLARTLFLLEQKYWDDWLKRHNEVDGLLSNVQITYRMRTWKKLPAKHKAHYYNGADAVIDLMKEKQ